MNHQPEPPVPSQAWQALLSLSGRIPSALKNTSNEITTSQLAKLFQEGGEEVRLLIDLYRPLCTRAVNRFVVAHLGQSLDGRIAAANGSSRWITGPEDVLHNHRMRALFEAVVVGAGTICYDDPQLTVRAVEGNSPIRVVIDPGRRLGESYKVFTDGEAETLLLCDAEAATPADRHGRAKVIGVEARDGRLAPEAVLERLDRMGVKRIFVEGGGVTVSRFLEAGCLDRLQITVAPIIIGSGIPSISLPEIADVGDGLRPPIRHLALGDDVLFECCFDEIV